MNDEATKLYDSLAPLLAAFDEGLAVGREPDLVVPPELAADFDACLLVLRLLNEAWPRPSAADTTIDQRGPAAVRHDAPAVPGERLGRFQVLSELGQGGFGVVYLAYDPTLARRVAVKTPRTDRWATPDFRRRFLQEGRAAALLDHPNIVRVLEAEATESEGYIASAYCEGPSLAVWLRERKAPPPCRLAAALTADLAAGVHHAHEHGVIHRDLKPANILLEIGSERDAAGLPRRITPKICDFGLAKMLEGEQTQTRDGVVMGTPQYMAPEQAEGRTGRIGPSTDVYSLGAVFYEMLLGRPPFQGEPGLDLLRRVAETPPERPSRRRKDVPRDLETIVLTCLEKEPGRRYASAAALETDLRRWLDGKAPLGRPEPWYAKIGRWVRRHPAWTVAAALCVLVAASLMIAWPYLHPDPNRVPQQMTAVLQQGRPVTLIPSQGGPAWQRWALGGEGATTEVTPQGVFKITSDKLSLLELLPDPSCDSYRLTARIRHEHSSYVGQVGIYCARRDCPSPKGNVEAFLRLTYCDIVNPSDLLTPAQRQTVPTFENNPVSLQHVFWSDEYGPEEMYGGTYLSSDRLFKATGFKSDQWRTLVIQVTPTDVRGYWAGDQLVGWPVSVEKLIQYTQSEIDDWRKDRPDDPVMRALTPGFNPRGGISIFVQEGTAAFQDVTLEPLR
jgi:serine/threonine-protein kinase